MTLGVRRSRSELEYRLQAYPWPIVAAVGAPDLAQSVAQHHCTGTADNVPIQAALDSLPSGRGEVLVIGGPLYIAATVLVGGTSRQVLRFEGSTDDSAIRPTANTPLFTLRREGEIYGPWIRCENATPAYTSNVVTYGTNLIAYKPQAVLHKALIRGDIGAGTGTAILMEVGAAPQGITLCRAEHLDIEGFEYGIHLHNPSTGGSTTGIFLNRFEDLYFADTLYCINENNDHSATRPIHGNRFLGVDIQWRTGMLEAIHADANGGLYECRIWDHADQTYWDVRAHGTGGEFNVEDNGTANPQINHWDITGGGNLVRDVRQNVWTYGGRVVSGLEELLHNRGTGTIASGATSVTITHGLSATPAANSIIITPTNNPTNAPGHIWVDTIGATTFRVNCTNDPGASGLTFSWRAYYI